MTSPILSTTARDIIESAYRVTNITPAQQAVKPFQVQRGLSALNLIIKNWQAQGLHLWSKTEAFIPLVVGQKKYKLGPDGDDITTERNDPVFCTNVETAAIATDTTVAVFDVSGFVVPATILSFSPTDSTQDWTALNSGTLSSDGTTLTVVNTTDAGGADFTLDVTSGNEFIIQFI